MTIELQRKPGTAMAQNLVVRGHQLVSDAPAEDGGGDEGPSPHDLYDASLGACKAVSLMWFARKKGIEIDIEGLERELGVPVVAVNPRKNKGLPGVVVSGR